MYTFKISLFPYWIDSAYYTQEQVNYTQELITNAGFIQFFCIGQFSSMPVPHWANFAVLHLYKKKISQANTTYLSPREKKVLTSQHCPVIIGKQTPDISCILYDINIFLTYYNSSKIYIFRSH